MTPMDALAYFVVIAFVACCAVCVLCEEWSRINAWIETERRRHDAEDRASAAAWDANHGEPRQFSETPMNRSVSSPSWAWLDSLPETGVER